MIEAGLVPGRTLMCDSFVTTLIPTSIIPAPTVAVAVSVAVAGLTVIPSASIVPTSGIIPSPSGIVPSPSSIISPGVKGILPGIHSPVRPRPVRAPQNQQKTSQKAQ
jgi:hypothetical protein